jgi:exodeoxyribonuclease V alpha subunit
VTVLDPAGAIDLPEAIDRIDPFDVRFVLSADGLLREFNAAGALAAADVHVARRIGRLCGEAGEPVLLAAAFAVRAPRLGHVCVDLAAIGEQVVVEGDAAVDLSTLPWPAPETWVGAVAASPLVAEGGPLRLVDSRLYLDRYWREEQQVAADLTARGAALVAGVDEDALTAGITRLFAGDWTDEHQEQATAAAVRRHLTVVAGGPGTGKTTTVARILALVHEQARASGRVPLVALAAPTGKAAARLQEAVHEAARQMAGDGVVDAAVRDRLLATPASTLHRLLGWNPKNRARFRHDRFNRLPHEVVIVDETSMVSLTLMARLLEAVRPTARLVLVGDPEQLASVEAGAVLGDIVGPADTDDAATGAVAGSIVVLRKGHRFGDAITDLAQAIQRGDADAVVGVLRSGAGDVRWVDGDAAASPGAPDEVRGAVVKAGAALFEAASAGDGRGALDALGRFRLLCAHRRGPYGVSGWTVQVEAWLAAAVPGFSAIGEWYAGRPILSTENDYGLELYNGDTGVVVQGDGALRAVFDRRGELVDLSPQRLGRVETVHAMTVHKAQGSQFAHVALLLPDPSSPILTRELLYTAATRARQGLLLVGTEDAVRAAVERPIARASGLRELLWG